MRVQLTLSPARDEQGAVAIVVAILLTVLLVISAFAVDFGMAYSNKRQMQTAADAAAIAAASVYANESGACNDAFRTAHQVAADAAGRSTMDQNYTYRPIADADYSMTTSCPGGFLTVQWQIQGQSDAGLGGVIGVGEIGINRDATAQVRIPSQISSGVRPYMICSRDIPATIPSGIIKAGFPPTTPGPTGSCPSANSPGNWWSVDCPEDSGNDLANNTLNGCDDPVGIVPNQPAVGAFPNTALRNHLVNVGCAGPPDEDCLESNPGQINGDGIWDAWASLVNNQTEVFLPVFCAENRCNPGAVEINGGGNNVDYPVHRMTAITVCGYDWGTGGSGNRRGFSNTGECAGNTFQVKNKNGDTDAAGVPDGINTDYIIFRVHAIQTAGTVTPSDCKPGDPCDGGARQVLLIE